MQPQPKFIFAAFPLTLAFIAHAAALPQVEHHMAIAPGPTVSPDPPSRLTQQPSSRSRAFGDQYDIAIQWACGGSNFEYLPDTGAGPGPCLQQTYDGLSASCGTNPFTGVGVNVRESETDNGNGTVTVVVQVESADGSALIPPGLTCDGGMATTSASPSVDTLACDLAKQNAGGPGDPGDPLDPALGVSPFEIVSAEAVILGSSGQTLLSFDLNSQGTTASELKDRFTVGGVDEVIVTALQFRYVMVTGVPFGACCFTTEECEDGISQEKCDAVLGEYFGDFSVCATVQCGPPANDDCSMAQPATDGVNPFHTDDATADAAGPAPCDSNMVTDVWFSYTATCTGTLSIDTCANGAGGDTVLEVYREDSCPPPAGSSSACADDSGCGVGGLSSQAMLSTTLGEDILIRLAGSDGAALSGDLTVQCTGQPTVGGACCTGPMSCVMVSSAAACPGSYLGDGSVCGVSFAVVAQASTTHFDSCGSDYNTILEIYDQCGGTLLASNDDCADTASGGGADPSVACFDPDPASSERDSCTCIATQFDEELYVRIMRFPGAEPPPGSSTSLFVTHGGACNAFPVGACCILGFCSEDIREGYCTGAGGAYQGDKTRCENVICVEPTGACCYSDGSCLDLIHQSDCVVGGNDWTNAICADIMCDCPGDLDGDRDVDLEDFRLYFDCLRGPDGTIPGGCESADLDGDGDCDSGDFWIFLDLFEKPCP